MLTNKGTFIIRGFVQILSCTVWGLCRLDTIRMRPMNVKTSSTSGLKVPDSSSRRLVSRSLAISHIEWVRHQNLALSCGLDWQKIWLDRILGLVCRQCGQKTAFCSRSFSGNRCALRSLISPASEILVLFQRRIEAKYRPAQWNFLQIWSPSPSKSALSAFRILYWQTPYWYDHS